MSTFIKNYSTVAWNFFKIGRMANYFEYVRIAAAVEWTWSRATVFEPVSLGENGSHGFTILNQSVRQPARQPVSQSVSRQKSKMASIVFLWNCLWSCSVLKKSFKAGFFLEKAWKYPKIGFFGVVLMILWKPHVLAKSGYRVILKMLLGNQIAGFFKL